MIGAKKPLMAPSTSVETQSPLFCLLSPIHRWKINRERSFKCISYLFLGFILYPSKYFEF